MTASSAPPNEAQAIARAAWTVASTAGTTPLSTADERGITGALSTVFGYHDPVYLRTLTRIASGELVRTITDPERRLELIRVLAVLALVDGGIEKDKLGIVVDMATALHVQAEFVDALTQLRLDHARWAGFDMIRANTMTIPGLPWAPDDPYGPFHPYGGDAQDPVLVARFDRLVDLPEDSLGNTLSTTTNETATPGPGTPTAWRSSGPSTTTACTCCRAIRPRPRVSCSSPPSLVGSSTRTWTSWRATCCRRS